MAETQDATRTPGETRNGKPRRRKPEVVFQERLAKASGDAQALARSLFDELRQQQQRITKLSARIAPEDALVLTGEEKASYEQYRSLGKPADLRRRLEESERQVSEAQRVLKGDTIRQAAEKLGWRSGMLDRLSRADRIEVKLVEEGTGGDKKLVPVALVPQEGKEPTETPLAEYAKANWSEALGALKLDPQAPNGKPRAGTPPVSNGRPMPPVTPTDTAPQSSDRIADGAI